MGSVAFTSSEKEEGTGVDRYLWKKKNLTEEEFKHIEEAYEGKYAEFIGNSHTHHGLGAKFSSTDWADVHENTHKHFPFYLNILWNHDKSATWAIGSFVVKEKLINSSEFLIPGQKEKEVLVTFEFDIEFERTVDDYFSELVQKKIDSHNKRMEELKKKREQDLKKSNNSRFYQKGTKYTKKRSTESQKFQELDYVQNFLNPDDWMEDLHDDLEKTLICPYCGSIDDIISDELGGSDCGVCHKVASKKVTLEEFKDSIIKEFEDSSRPSLMKTSESFFTFLSKYISLSSDAEAYIMGEYESGKFL
jgi:hypothetical protein